MNGSGKRRRRSLARRARGAVAALVLAMSGIPTVASSDTRVPPPVDEIVVVASKTARPLSSVASPVTTIQRERLEWEQVRELADLARYEPAIEADFNTPRFGNTGLSIRGVGGNRIALELDGVPLPTQFDVGNFADSGRMAIDPSIIERIEVLRGPASSLYGSDAIGGVVVITTVDPRDLVGAERSYSIGGGLAYFSAIDGRLARATAAWAEESDGVLLSAIHRQGHEAKTKSKLDDHDRLSFEQWQLFAKWTHDIEDLGRLAVSGDFFQRDTDSDLRALLGYERFANTSEILGDDRQTRYRLTATYALPPLPWLDESSVMFYRQDNDTEQLTDESRVSRGVAAEIDRSFFFDERSHGSEVRLRKDVTTGSVDHVVVAGVEWDRQELEQRRDGLQRSVATGETTKNLLGEQFPTRDLPKTTTDEVGVYLQDELSYGPFTLIPGVRWDAISLDAETDAVLPDEDRIADLDDDEFSWRLGATFRARDELTLFGSYAQGFRAPPAEDVNLFLDLEQFQIRSIPNPELVAETSDNWEVGLRWRDVGVAVNVSGYYSTYDDFIESRARIGVDPESGFLLFQSRNIDEATIYGVETDAEIGLFVIDDRLASWTLDAGVHWSEGENDVTDEPLNSVAPLKAIAGLRWRPLAVPLEVGFRATHLAEQDQVDMTEESLFVPPSATILDLHARYALSQAVDVYLGLNNLTDERYWRYADVRHYEPDDPRVEAASRPGFNADLTLNVKY